MSVCDGIKRIYTALLCNLLLILIQYCCLLFLIYWICGRARHCRDMWCQFVMMLTWMTLAMRKSGIIILNFVIHNIMQIRELWIPSINYFFIWKCVSFVCILGHGASPISTAELIRLWRTIRRSQVQFPARVVGKWIPDCEIFAQTRRPDAAV